MVKTPPANAGDAGDSGLTPGSGRSPGEGKDNPLQHFFFIYLASPDLSCSTGDLVPRPWTRLRPPALGAQSLSHWPTREVPALHCPWLENPTDRGPRRATVHGLTESDTTERYADYKCMYGWQSHSKHKMGSWILINTMQNFHHYGFSCHTAINL